VSIIIQTIKHDEQRYNTVGDYQTKDGVTILKISDLGDWRMEFLVALHELIELTLCRKAGITDAMIDEFDFEFERNRKASDVSEPGDDPRAPYYKQHQFATKVEKMMSRMLGVSWSEYGNRCALTTKQYRQ
jgi:hypothetical protein